jgi:hypothetical protein
MTSEFFYRRSFSIFVYILSIYYNLRHWYLSKNIKIIITESVYI